MVEEEEQGQRPQCAEEKGRSTWIDGERRHHLAVQRPPAAEHAPTPDASGHPVPCGGRAPFR